jgi:hypothetical protein
LFTQIWRSKRGHDSQMFFETSFFLAFSRPSAGRIEPLNGPYLARGPSSIKWCLWSSVEGLNSNVFRTDVNASYLITYIGYLHRV